MKSSSAVLGAAAGGALVLTLQGCGGGDDTTTTTTPNPVNDQYIIDTFGGDSDFLWGSATAAAQIEGGWNASGKQPSIWDDFCHNITAKTGDTTLPFSKVCGKVPEGVTNKELWTTLDITDDFYSNKHFTEDIGRVAQYNMNAMRVSISWPRLMPLNEETGKHELSQDGVDYYKKVFEIMDASGVTPFVTLFHWDLPNDLSWLNETVVDEFDAYAKAAFESFPTVKNWATFNEPNSVCSLGYAIGAFAPGHKSTTDHLVCGHHILLSHAKAVAAYRETYDGQIGIVLDYKWAYPQDPNSENDNKAAAWDRDNVMGFWADPIFKSGDYPSSLREFFGDKLPTFTAGESKLLNGSADFWGLNTYGGKIAVYNDKKLADYKPGDDMAERYSFSPCNEGADKSAVVDEAWECGAASGWLWAKPVAIRDYLNHVTTYYKAPKIYVTEFGVDVKDESEKSKEEALNDEYRQEYYQRYLYQVALAKKEDNVPLKGVFAWSLMDNFEWGDGLNFRFGITFVDFTDPALPRTAKKSAEWWTELIGNMSSNASFTEINV
jgi:beta-glucosidase/6-phospho-beta-glucosidase/beta-galactosidase